MKRAGLDYVKDLNLYVYENYEEFEQKILENIIFLRVIHIFVTLIKTLAMIKKNIIYFLVMNMMEYLKKF